MNKSIWCNNNWQPFQPWYTPLYYHLILHACKTFISHIIFGQENISVQLSDLVPSDIYPAFPLLTLRPPSDSIQKGLSEVSGLHLWHPLHTKTQGNTGAK